MPERDGTVARASFDELMNHEWRLFEKDKATSKHSNLRLTHAPLPRVKRPDRVVPAE